MTQVQTVDVDQEEKKKTYGVQTLKSEVNFLIFPFFALSREDVNTRTKTEHKVTVKRTGKKLEILWKVTCNSEYGYPGPFSKKIHKAFEEIINELEPPLKNPIPFSIYELCKKAGISTGGRDYKKVKKALKRTMAALIESKGAFYSKKRKKWVEDTFHLYDRLIFKGEELPDGTVAETNYLYLSSWYLENLNALYIKPLDYRYYKSLRSGIAQRLYELLGVKFYWLLSHAEEQPCIRYKYSTLCQLLPVTRQKYLSLVKQQFEPAHRELTKTEFLSRAEFLDSKEDPKDWLISYYPGPRAQAEIRKAVDKVESEKEEGLEQDTQLPAEAPQSQSEEEALVKSLTNSMLEVLEDKESQPFYEKLAKLCLEKPPLENLIFRSLSETKDAARREVIKTTKGAYFTDLIKRYAKKRGIDLGLKSG